MKKGFVLGLITGLVATGVSVVLANSQIQAILNNQIKIKLNGKVQEFKDETTNEMQYPITYQDRTYLPLRTVANLVGVDVDYDASSNTAMLTQKQTSYAEPISVESIKQISKIINKLKEIPEKEVLNLYNKIDKSRFALKTLSNIFNSCKKEDNHIIIGKEILDSKNLSEVPVSMFLDMYIEDSEENNMPYHYLNYYADDFGYEVINFDMSNDSFYPKVVLLKYNNYYTIFNVKEIQSDDLHSEYVIDANEYSNFIAYIINHNANIKIIEEKDQNSSTNVKTKIEEKDNYKKKIDDSKERIYTVDIAINGKNYSIPQMNFDNDYLKKQNKELIDFITDKINQKNDITIDYEYHLNNDILALIVNVSTKEEVLDCFVYNVMMIGGNSLTSIGLINLNQTITESECVEMIKEYQEKLEEVFDEYNYNYGNVVVNEGNDGIIGSTRMYFDENNELHLILRTPISGRFWDSAEIDNWLKEGIVNK